MGETQPGIAPLRFPTTQVLRAHTKQQTQSERTQTQSTPSLAEAHYSHGVATFEDTPAVAGCMKFPCQPQKKTQQLCGVKVAAPRCCPQFTWQEEFHARIVPDPSLFECPTEHVKKIPARKMAFKYLKSACFLRWRWRAVPHNPIKVALRTEWRQLIINRNNCADAKSSRDLGFTPDFGDDMWHQSVYVRKTFRGTVLSSPAVPRHKRAEKKNRSALSGKGVTVGHSTPRFVSHDIHICALHLKYVPP
ncbi:hypothetical protein TCSYLVIO_006305 [Trypanosoma cruzi]|nr:hypothetical protein TCSYLVIO_006305 [Trypanosoma cruzi]